MTSYEDLPMFVNTESYAYYVIHGAFMCGIQIINWHIGGKLKDCYTLFHNSPARRADYFTLTASEIFPQFLFQEQYIKEEKVAEPVIGIWENIKDTVK